MDANDDMYILGKEEITSCSTLTWDQRWIESKKIASAGVSLLWMTNTVIPNVMRNLNDTALTNYCNYLLFHTELIIFLLSRTTVRLR